MPFTSFVALLWIFFQFFWRIQAGHKTELLYSTIILTKALYKHRKTALSICLIFLLIIPKILCFIYPFVYMIRKLPPSFSSTITPKYFILSTLSKLHMPPIVLSSYTLFRTTPLVTERTLHLDIFNFKLHVKTVNFSV